MVEDQEKEEIVPVTGADVLPGELEDQAADGDGHHSEYQVPWTKSSLTGLCLLKEPSVEKADEHTEDLGYRHDDLIVATHLLYHLDIVGPVHDSDLLCEVFLHQRRDRVDDEDRPEGSDEVTESHFFFVYLVRIRLAVHKGLFKQTLAE